MIYVRIPVSDIVKPSFRPHFFGSFVFVLLVATMTPARAPILLVFIIVVAVLVGVAAVSHDQNVTSATKNSSIIVDSCDADDTRAVAINIIPSFSLLPDYNIRKALYGLLESSTTSPSWQRLLALTTGQCDPSMQPPDDKDVHVNEYTDAFATIFRWDEVSDDDLGYPQVLNPHYDNDVNQHQRTAILQLLDKAHDYIYNTIMVDEKYRLVRDECYNDNEYCAYWATRGMCETHADFMHYYCAPVCFTCHELHPETKCPLPDNVEDLNAWQRPGDINHMFERIVSHQDFAQYQPKAVSRPSYAHGDDKYSATYEIGPWVVILENFITEQEAEFLIEFGKMDGFERSRTKTGAVDEYGEFIYKESKGRTSTTTWCLDDCATSSVNVAIQHRMQHLTGIPYNNSESLQLLHYDEGQFYHAHHDYIQHQALRIQGARILTIFLYLNNVTDGGGTNFDKLDITVQPKLGRAVIWPSVLDYPPHFKDPRTTHQALPVIKGEKYAANAWLHMRDVRGAHERGCALK